MSGTSFSTALATRAVSHAMLSWVSKPEEDRKKTPAPGTEAWFCERAEDDDAHAHWPGATVAEKAGCGRKNGPSTGRMDRAPERR